MANDPNEKAGRSRKRHLNGGLRKLCPCPRKRWAKCEHSWYFNFKWRGEHYRFSLDRQLGKHIDDKTTARTEAERIRIEIRSGRFGPNAAPVLETLTVRQLLDTYMKRYAEVERQDALTHLKYRIDVVKRTEIERPDGQHQPLGDWLVSDVTTDTVERFRGARRV